MSPTCITRTKATSEKKSPAFHFFGAIPFGFTADELFAWVQYGGGQELWDALSGQFNIKPLLCPNTGCQMGGWFTREITSPEGFKGLRYRMTGPGAEVLRRLGAIVVVVPGGEIMQSLKSGAIDASEWVGPWLDMALGLHKAAGYYYYPGFHEPGTGITLGINKGVWESFDASDRRVIEAVAACRIRALPGGVQREQRAVAAQTAGRRLRQDPEVRRLGAEGNSTASARTWSPRPARATSFPRKSTRATSSSARRSWIGATSPSAPS